VNGQVAGVIRVSVPFTLVSATAARSATRAHPAMTMCRAVRRGHHCLLPQQALLLMPPFTLM